MQGDPIIFSLFLIFTGAAVLAAIALYAHQSMLVAYIVLGAVVGPSGLALVSESSTIEGIGHTGIIFLLFLLGLNLHPQKLLNLLREATLVTGASSLVFAAIGFGLAWGLGFGWIECLVIGAVMTLSSTIIGLKLLPTTALHHRHVGEVIISVLLLQDVGAIVLLVVLENLGSPSIAWSTTTYRLLALPGLAIFAFVLEHRLLLPVIARFDTIQEYVFLVAIGWCLGVAQLGHALGLSYEMGAFIAGVALASSPIATFIAESLKPLRDFFLIMFFFSLGAGFSLAVLPDIAAPALVIAVVMLLVKPLVFKHLLMWEKESERLSTEIGVRLGQGSEFALLIAVLALQAGIIGERASFLIQSVTLITFIVSSYVIMMRYPTPIAVSARLRRD